MNHSPALQPHAAAAHDKGYLQRLLSERNQLPASGTGVIDAAIEQAFVRSGLENLALLSCGQEMLVTIHQRGLLLLPHRLRHMSLMAMRCGVLRPGIRPISEQVRRHRTSSRQSATSWRP